MEFSAYNIVLIVASLVVAITIHEAMHAYVSNWLGDPTARDEGRVTLNPAPHIDPFMTILLPVVLVALSQPPILAARPVPFNPNRVRFEEFGAALVGISGPFINLVLAVLSALTLGLLQPDFGSVPRDILLVFTQINVALFVFNMLPLPPLDGSRLVYALAPDPVRRVMEQIEQLGIVAIIAILFLLLPFIGPVIENLNDYILRVLV